MRWSGWCCDSGKRRGRGATMLRRTPSGTLWRTPGWLSMTPPRARDGNLSDEVAEQAMSGQKKGGSDGRAAGGGGYSKSGKPRPGTGGNRRDRLEGKGPTPPAYMRPGHPAQRAAAARAADGRPPRKAEEG